MTDDSEEAMPPLSGLEERQFTRAAEAALRRLTSAHTPTLREAAEEALTLIERHASRTLRRPPE